MKSTGTLTRLLTISHERAAEEVAKISAKASKMGKAQRAKMEDELI